MRDRTAVEPPSACDTREEDRVVVFCAEAAKLIRRARNDDEEFAVGLAVLRGLRSARAHPERTLESLRCLLRVFRLRGIERDERQKDVAHSRALVLALRQRWISTALPEDPAVQVEDSELAQLVTHRIEALPPPRDRMVRMFCLGESARSIAERILTPPISRHAVRAVSATLSQDARSVFAVLGDVHQKNNPHVVQLVAAELVRSVLPGIFASPLIRLLIMGPCASDVPILEAV